MAPTIARFIVENLFEALVARGCDPDALRTMSGLRRSGPPFVPYRRFDDLVRAGLELTGDAHLGLTLCGGLKPEMSGPLGLLLLACPDLGSAMERIVRFQRLISDPARLSLVRRRREWGLRVTLPEPDHPAAPHVVDWMLGDHRSVTEVLVGRSLRPTCVAFRRPRPADTTRHEAWFGPHITWNGEHDELLLGEEDWRAPVRSASVTFREIFERQARRALALLPSHTSLQEQVRRQVMDHLPEQLTVEQTADALRVSTRTLQRALRAEGTSFSEIVDTVRRHVAQQLLSAGVDIGETSWSLGYSEPSAFHRAFRRWFDATPAEWRDQAGPFPVAAPPET